MLENQWYIGSSTQQLRAEPLAAQIGGKKLVLYRDAEGRPCALRDRCCHRGFPLSKGRVRDGRIACGYHGWEYDSDGRCARIPFNGDRPIPKTFGVESYPVQERDGYVWVWMGPKLPTTAPSIPELASEKWHQGSQIIACEYVRALEITADVLHIFYVHPTHAMVMAGEKFGLKDVPYEMRTTDSGYVFFAPPTNEETEPIGARAVMMEYRVPGTIRIEWASPKLYMYWFAQPVTENSCRLDWLVSRPGAAQDDGPAVWPEDRPDIIREDVEVLEAIQQAYDHEGEGFECSVESDLPALLLRRILRAAEKGEPPMGIGKRRILSYPGPISWA